MQTMVYFKVTYTTREINLNFNNYIIQLCCADQYIPYTIYSQICKMVF